jgi:hypothetical protein
VGWVEPAFFDEKAKVRSMTIHGAPRQVGGVAIDVPVIVMENRHGFSIQPKAQVREVVASRPSTPATT